MTNSNVDWNDLFLFSQVVEHQGFTAAGDALGIPKSRISRRVSLLEEQLNIRLLQRSSRKLSLTEAGRVLHAHCMTMLNEANAGLHALQNRSSQPVGKVRLSLPLALADVMSATLLPRFIQRYPQVQLVIQATNRSIDLIDEHMDVVVRGVGLEPSSIPSSLVKACVCTAQWALMCSPAYLEKQGSLANLTELSKADSLLYTPNDEQGSSLLLINDEAQIASVQMQVRLQSDNLSVLRQFALAGFGVCGLPLYACRDDIQAGKLKIVMLPWRPKPGHLVVLFPSRRGVAPAVRAFVEFLKVELPAIVVGSVI